MLGGQGLGQNPQGLIGPAEVFGLYPRVTRVLEGFMWGDVTRPDGSWVGRWSLSLVTSPGHLAPQAPSA